MITPLVVQDCNKCLLNAKWIHIRCVAHILNLVVQDGIKKVDSSVEIVRWAVKWIRHSPSRIANFTKFARLVNPGITKHLRKDCPTRWNSTYLMLEIAQEYEKTFERYDLEEYDFRADIEKAGLTIPTPGDWEKVRHLCHFLKPFCDVTERLSGTLYVTSNTCIEEIYSIRTLLDNAMNDANLCGIAMAMKVKFDKYFGELEKFLKESVEDDSDMFNILDWWKVNSPRFPVLSLMARDLFAIPVSTVASESVFSTSGRILDPYRSSLTSKMLESTICTQDWLRGGISEKVDYEQDWEQAQQIDKELGDVTSS